MTEPVVSVNLQNAQRKSPAGIWGFFFFQKESTFNKKI